MAFQKKYCRLNNNLRGRFKVTQIVTLVSAILATNVIASAPSHSSRHSDASADSENLVNLLVKNGSESVFSINDIQKSLYFNKADVIPADEDSPELKKFSRDRAAFRFLDLSYELDPKTNTVFYRFGDGEFKNNFSDLYGNDERTRVRKVRDAIVEQLNKSPENSDIEQLLLDIYFEQAVAEIIAGNQLIDKARIDRLGSGSIEHEIELYNAAVAHFEKAFNTYNELFSQYGNILVKYEAQRSDKSFRYIDKNGSGKDIIDNSGLYVGYKDVRIFYEMMNKWAYSLAQAVKLEGLKNHASRKSNEDLIEKVNNALNLYSTSEQSLKALFPSIKFDSVNETTGLPLVYARFNAVKAELGSLAISLTGETNLLGFSKHSVLIFPDYEEHSDSFDSLIKLHNPTKGTLGDALIQFGDVNDKLDFIQLNQESLSKDLKQYLNVINIRLADLIGFKVNNIDKAANKLRSKKDCEGSICISQSNIEHSSIFIKNNSILTTQEDIERNKEKLLRSLVAIENEIKRGGQEQGVENPIEKIEVHYDNQKVKLSKSIAEIRDSFENFQERADYINGFVNTIDGVVHDESPSRLLSSVPAEVISSLEHIGAELNKYHKGFKKTGVNSNISKLSYKLPKEERVVFHSLNPLLLDVTSEKFIANLWLEAKAIELEIAVAEASLDAEIEQLIRMFNQVQSLITQGVSLDINRLERHFSDPINLHRAVSGLLSAEHSFEKAQQWMFNIDKTLEYKWQQTFSYLTGIDKLPVVVMRNSTELKRFYSTMLNFDELKQRTQVFQESLEVISIKKDILGYHHKTQNELQCYQHPFSDRRDEISNIIEHPFEENECALSGDGTLLDSNYAFRAYLAGSLISASWWHPEEWISLSFSTAKPVRRSQLFSGLKFKKNEDGTCIASGGNYNGKMIEVGVDINTEAGGYDESTLANLSYLGSSYFRAKKLSSNDDISKSLDKIEVIQPKFFNPSGNHSDIKQTSIDASIIAGSSSNINYGTFAFNELSFNSSSWNLDLLYSDFMGELFDINSVDDISLVVKHKYLSRNVRTCQ